MAFGADEVSDSRGMAVADFDNDGDLDIVVNTNIGDCGSKSVPPVLLQNDIGQTRNSLVVQLTGVASNRNAIGAVVRVEVTREDGSLLHLTRHVHCGSGYASQNDLRLFFGLGDSSAVSQLQVDWPSGQKQSFTESIKANQLIEIIEGGDAQQNRLAGDKTNRDI